MIVPNIKMGQRKVWIIKQIWLLLITTTFLIIPLKVQITEAERLLQAHTIVSCQLEQVQVPQMVGMMMEQVVTQTRKEIT